MREIEFRGIRVDNGEMVFGNYFHWFRYGNKIPIIGSGVQNGSVNGFEVISETVGQYTGLKDKNGVKVFEADIMSKVSISELGKKNQYFYVVIWSSSDQGFKTKQYVLDENESGIYWRIKNEGFFDFISMVKTYNHVTGNIHQNKELLQ